MFKYRIIMNNINYIKLKPVTTNNIISWSYGQIKNSGTINIRTKKPILNGLFCLKIFGPINSFICYCNIYNNNLFSICKFCGVTYTSSIYRRYKFGHIKLNVKIINPGFLKLKPYIYSLLLNLKNSFLVKIIYYKLFIVLYSKVNNILVGSYYNYDNYVKILQEYKNNVLIDSGGNAIYYMLSKINLFNKINILLVEIKNNNLSNDKLSFLIKQLRLFVYMILNNINPIDLVLLVLPILPPYLRPVIFLEYKNFTTADINCYYIKIIDINSRINKLYSINAPSFVIVESKRLLQTSIDDLFGVNTTNAIDNKSKNINTILTGKYGRIRHNLLGKRVNYSARAVITVEPNIDIYLCGIPYILMLELFKPLILKHINQINNKFIPYEILFSKFIYKILCNLIKGYYIILNRAPTLHRMNIQSFKPYLVYTNTIKINPLVCKSYNADFDGDQMSLHLPLSNYSNSDAKYYLLSSLNIFSPSNNSLTMLPSHESILGIFYLTFSTKNIFISLLYFSSYYELYNYYINNNNCINQFIFFYLNYGKVIRTTIGRVLFFYSLNINFLLLRYNKIIFYKDIVLILKSFYIKFKSFIKLSNLIFNLNNLGFKFSKFSPSYIQIKDNKNCNYYNINKYNSFYKKYLLYRFLFKNLLISYNFFIFNLKNIFYSFYIININIMEYGFYFFSKFILNKYFILFKYNFLVSVSVSNARSIKEQIKHLLFLRGFVSINQFPFYNFLIYSNLFSGLSSFNFFISVYGSRKGLNDTAINTAYSGYLTRKLVCSSKDIIIKKYDCNATTFIKYNINNYNSNYSIFINFLLGRVLAYNIYNNKGIILCYKNNIISSNIIKLLIQNNINYVYVRSPIYCRLRYYDICQLCYGLDCSMNSLISLGSPVGVTASQSIGEPGTQLTMRTFHTGGFINCVPFNIIKIKQYCMLNFIKNYLILYNIFGEIIKIIEIKHNLFFNYFYYNFNLFISFKNILYDFKFYDIINSLVYLSKLFEANNNYSLIFPITGIFKNLNYIIQYNYFINKFRLFNLNNIKLYNNNLVLRGKNYGNNFSLHYILYYNGINYFIIFFIKKVIELFKYNNININIIHIEIILKVLLRLIIIKSKGVKNFSNIKIIRSRHILYKNKNYNYYPLIIGLSDTYLCFNSFISSASYKQTLYVLYRSSIYMSYDYLKGVNENLIIGFNTPIGGYKTGYYNLL